MSNTILKKLVGGQMGSTKTLEYGKEGKKIIVKVTPVISFSERIDIIRNILSMCFINDGDNLEDYAPGLKKMAQRYAIISAYTDLDVPEDIEEAWLVLNYTSIYDDVVNIVGDDIKNVLDEADEMINAKRDYLIHKIDFRSILDKVYDAINSLGDKMGDIDINQLLSAFQGAEGFSKENILDAMKKLTEKNINKDKKTD